QETVVAAAAAVRTGAGATCAYGVACAVARATDAAMSATASRNEYARWAAADAAIAALWVATPQWREQVLAAMRCDLENLQGVAERQRRTCRSAVDDACCGTIWPL